MECYMNVSNQINVTNNPSSLRALASQKLIPLLEELSETQIERLILLFAKSPAGQRFLATLQVTRFDRKLGKQFPHAVIIETEVSCFVAGFYRIDIRIARPPHEDDLLQELLSSYERIFLAFIQTSLATWI